MPHELSEQKIVPDNKKWQAHMKAWRQSGLSGKEYCRQYQLSYHGFVYWKKKLSSRQPPAIELVPVSTGVRREGKSCGLKIEVGGRFKVEIPDDFTPRTLARVIATLEACR